MIFVQFLQIAIGGPDWIHAHADCVERHPHPLVCGKKLKRLRFPFVEDHFQPQIKTNHFPGFSRTSLEQIRCPCSPKSFVSSLMADSNPSLSARSPLSSIQQSCHNAFPRRSASNCSEFADAEIGFRTARIHCGGSGFGAGGRLGGNCSYDSVSKYVENVIETVHGAHSSPGQ